MLEVDFLKPVKKFLKRLSIKHKKQVIQKSLELAINPTPNDSLMMKGFPDYYRTDIGEYRIIYRFSTVVVTIVIIGKRNDDEVYRKFRRLM